MNPDQLQSAQGLPQMPVPPQGVSVPPDAGQPITDAQRQELTDTMGKIKDELDRFQAMQFAAKQKSDILRNKILGGIFEKLQTIGVDLNDQASVSEFINGIRQKSPELADQFEMAMNVLIGEDSGADEYGSPRDLSEPVDIGSDQNNEMNNENIPADPRGQPQASIG